jgi:hypothetical protein
MIETDRALIIDVRTSIVHVSLYIAGKRSQARLVPQASHSKTALERTHEGLPTGLTPPALSRHRYVPETPPPPPSIRSRESYTWSDSSDSESELGDSPLQIQIGPAREGYIWDRIRGHVYRCQRGPHGCSCSSCSLWLRGYNGFGGRSWVASVVIGHGAILVSQRTWAA